jgi:hypothetical protein
MKCAKIVSKPTPRNKPNVIKQRHLVYEYIILRLAENWQTIRRNKYDEKKLVNV